MMTLSLLCVAMAFAALVVGTVLARGSKAKEVIKTDRAPLPMGPYSQAIRYGDLVFVSGQLGLNKETKALEATVTEQTVTALTHIKTILESAGSGMDCIVKTTIFLADMNDFLAVNEAYSTFLGASPPARATVQVARLPLGGLVEIEAVAHVR